MITSLKEAEAHANHTSLYKYKNVVVFSDGSIHASNDDVEISKIVTPDCFIVKGHLTLPKPKKVQEPKETIE